MTDDLQPLALLLAQAERQRDDALAEQLKAETAQRAAEAQAEQLVAYRREYEQRWSAEFCREGKIELVRCYQGFIHRLTQAVEQQQRVAAHAAVQAERAEAIVRGHELRAAALEEADRAARCARASAPRRSHRAEGKRRPRRARGVEPADRAGPAGSPSDGRLAGEPGARPATPLPAVAPSRRRRRPRRSRARTPPSNATARAHPFAELLRQNRATATTPRRASSRPHARRSR